MQQDHHSMKAETFIESVKAAPAVGGTIVSAATLNEWVAVATLLYIVTITVLR